MTCIFIMFNFRRFAMFVEEDVTDPILAVAELAELAGLKLARELTHMPFIACLEISIARGRQALPVALNTRARVGKPYMQQTSSCRQALHLHTHAMARHAHAHECALGTDQRWCTYTCRCWCVVV